MSAARRHRIVLDVTTREASTTVEVAQLIIMAIRSLPGIEAVRPMSYARCLAADKTAGIDLHVLKIDLDEAMAVLREARKKL